MGEEREENKNQIVPEITFNVEIWLILKCNLQFSSILFLEENIFYSRGRSSKHPVMTSLPVSGPTSIQNVLPN